MPPSAVARRYGSVSWRSVGYWVATGLGAVALLVPRRALLKEWAPPTTSGPSNGPKRGIFVAIAVLLDGFCFWWTRRHLT
jgi:hypothetical protein